MLKIGSGVQDPFFNPKSKFLDDDEKRQTKIEISENNVEKNPRLQDNNYQIKYQIFNNVIVHTTYYNLILV